MTMLRFQDSTSGSHVDQSIGAVDMGFNFNISHPVGRLFLINNVKRKGKNRSELHRLQY